MLLHEPLKQLWTIQLSPHCPIVLQHQLVYDIHLPPLQVLNMLRYFLKLLQVSVIAL